MAEKAVNPIRQYGKIFSGLRRIFCKYTAINRKATDYKSADKLLVLMGLASFFRFMDTIRTLCVGNNRFPIKFSQPDSAFDSGVLSMDRYSLWMTLGHAVGIADKAADYAGHFEHFGVVVVLHLFHCVAE